MATSLFSVWIGLTICLVILEAITERKWEHVVEISFYQGAALIAAYFVLHQTC